MKLDEALRETIGAEISAQLKSFEDRLIERFRMVLEESGRTALLTDEQAAEMMNSPSVEAWQARVRRSADGLASLALRVGKQRRWRRSDLQAYFARREGGAA